MQTLPTAPPPAALPATADAPVDIDTVMATIDRILPTSTVLPRPENIENLVAEPADHSWPLQSAIDRVRPPAVDCRWLPRCPAPEEGSAR